MRGQLRSRDVCASQRHYEKEQINGAVVVVLRVFFLHSLKGPLPDLDLMMDAEVRWRSAPSHLNSWGRLSAPHTGNLVKPVKRWQKAMRFLMERRRILDPEYESAHYAESR